MEPLPSFLGTRRAVRELLMVLIWRTWFCRHVLSAGNVAFYQHVSLAMTHVRVRAKNKTTRKRRNAEVLEFSVYSCLSVRACVVATLAHGYRGVTLNAHGDPARVTRTMTPGNHATGSPLL